MSLKRGVILVFVIIIVLIITIIFFQAKSKYFDDGVSIEISPESNYINLRNGDSKVVEFDIEIKNKLGCKSICSYQIRDLSEEINLYNKTITIDNKIKDSFNVSSNYKGRGLKLYSIDTECHDIKSVICSTDEHIVLANSLIVVNYTISEDEELISKITYETTEKLYSDMKKIDEILFNNKFLLDNIINISKKVIGSELEYKKNKDDFNNIIINTDLIKEYWRIEDYNEIRKIINNINTTNLRSDSEKQKEEIINIIKIHNSNIILLKNINNQTIEEIYSFYQKYNYTDESKEILYYSDKLKNLNLPLENVTLYIEEFNELNLKYNHLFLNNTRNITNTNISHITLNLDFPNISNQTQNYSSNISINLPEHRRLCILNNQIKECGEDRKNPIILIHGHSFNEDASIDFSLRSLSKIQKELEKEGYLNLGELKINEIDEEIWRSFPISVRATYYEISLIHLGENIISTRKSERIENYALRLRDIINKIRQKSSSEKVTIISHSMGGLVGREYIRLFEDYNIDKFIMIGTPNKGLKGKSASLCSVFGSSKECEDMKEGSVFLNILNSYEPKEGRYYNIIGKGCDTEGEDGDGVVVVNNTMLVYSTNYYINGTCPSSLNNLLHNELLNPLKYPKVVKIIKEII